MSGRCVRVAQRSSPYLSRTTMPCRTLPRGAVPRARVPRARAPRPLSRKRPRAREEIAGGARATKPEPAEAATSEEARRTLLPPVRALGGSLGEESSWTKAGRRPPWLASSLRSRTKPLSFPASSSSPSARSPAFCEGMGAVRFSLGRSTTWEEGDGSACCSRRCSAEGGLVKGGTLTLVRQYGSDGKSQLGYVDLAPKEARFSGASIDELLKGKKGGAIKRFARAVLGSPGVQRGGVIGATIGAARQLIEKHGQVGVIRGSRHRPKKRSGV